MSITAVKILIEEMNDSERQNLSEWLAGQVCAVVKERKLTDLEKEIDGCLKSNLYPPIIN